MPYILYVWGLGFQIGKRDIQVSQPAILSFDLITVVYDILEGVEVLLLIERGIEIGVDGAHSGPILRNVVHHHIYHEVHVSLVQFVRELLQRFHGTEVLIDVVDILGPESMVAFSEECYLVDVFDDGGDPDL